MIKYFQKSQMSDWETFAPITSLDVLLILFEKVNIVIKENKQHIWNR